MTECRNCGKDYESDETYYGSMYCEQCSEYFEGLEEKNQNDRDFFNDLREEYLDLLSADEQKKTDFIEKLCQKDKAEWGEIFTEIENWLDAEETIQTSRSELENDIIFL